MTPNWITKALRDANRLLREMRQPPHVRQARQDRELRALGLGGDTPRFQAARRFEAPARRYTGQVLPQWEEDMLDDFEWQEYFASLPELEKQRRRKLAGVNLRERIDFARTGRKRSCLYW